MTFTEQLFYLILFYNVLLFVSSFVKQFFFIFFFSDIKEMLHYEIFVKWDGLMASASFLTIHSMITNHI